MRDGANPVLVGVEDGLFARVADKDGPPHRTSWLGADGFYFPFLLRVVQVGAWCPNTLLVPDVRALADPFFPCVTSSRS